MTRPWLSVILPTYNGGPLLTETLESVAREADSGVEVVAVDDGSTDDTPAVLAAYSSRLAMTVVRRRIGNWAANTNHGLGLARGEWACILHQDDVWRPGRLLPSAGGWPWPRCRAPPPRLSVHRRPGPADLGPWTCPLARRRPLPPTVTIRRLLVQISSGYPAACSAATPRLAVGAWTRTCGTRRTGISG